jgi:hypothetical protein
MASVDLRADTSITMQSELEADISGFTCLGWSRALQIEHSRPSFDPYVPVKTRPLQSLFGAELTMMPFVNAVFPISFRGIS